MYYYNHYCHSWKLNIIYKDIYHFNIKMDEITRITNLIETTENLVEKNNLINSLNEIIILEKNKLANISLDITKFKIPIKYKKKTIEQMEELLHNTPSIDEAIIIYNTIVAMVKNIKDGLFNENNEPKLL
jgi:hypothetical protein